MRNYVEIGHGEVQRVRVGPGLPLVLIGGPCAIESRDHTLRMAEMIFTICERVGVPFVFKACYDKDCRSSANSFLGIGKDEGLQVLAEVRSKIGVPVTSDVSSAEWVSDTAEVIDLLQIPAYLCRQTHLLTAAAKTGRPINIKKGQFMSPWNMINSVRKVQRAGNDQVILSDRGTFFGYNMLVNDFRSFRIMAQTGCPVCFDATHSVQLPTSLGTISGGQREFIPSLVRAATACGIHALFMEIHDDPDQALSDPATQLKLTHLEKILRQAKVMHEMREQLLTTLGADDVD